MLIKRVFAAALLLSVPVAPALADVDRAYDRDCWSQREVAAAQIQRFKTMLLVGALHCRDASPYMMADYNRFLRVQRGFVNANAQVVRDRFVRKFGPTYGLTAFTDFETQLGNRIANDQFDDYRCETVANYARLAAQVSEAGLVDLARSVDEEEQLPVCTPAMRYAGGRWAPPAPSPVAEIAPPPPPAPVMVATVAPPPPPAPIEVASADLPAAETWPDLAPVEREVHPVSVDPNAAVKAAAVQVAEVRPAVAETPAPAAEKPDPAQALRDAIKSLTIAAEALEAQKVVAALPTR